MNGERQTVGDRDSGETLWIATEDRRGVMSVHVTDTCPRVTDPTPWKAEHLYEKSPICTVCAKTTGVRDDTTDKHGDEWTRCISCESPFVSDRPAAEKCSECRLERRL